MVMLIIALLGNSAIAAFLDFSKEAKTAGLIFSMNTMNEGLKNQLLQIRMNCRPAVPAVNGIPPRIHNSMLHNDVTFDSTDPDDKICTTSEVPVAANRLFFQKVTGNERAFLYNQGSDPIPSDRFSELPRNPFQSPTDLVTGVNHVLPIHSFSLLGGTPMSGDLVCNRVDFYRSAGIRFHWIYDTANGHIHAATNTPGVRECAIFADSQGH